MGYSTRAFTRESLIYGYGSSLTTVSSPQSGRPFQPINSIVRSGKKDENNSGLTLTGMTIQGSPYTNALNPKFSTILHLDIIMERNQSGIVDYVDHAVYYSKTLLYDYRLDLSAFEVTSTFYEGAIKTLLSVTDGTTFINLQAGELMGWFFRTNSNASSDMVVPYSRLYGWSGVIT